MKYEIMKTSIPVNVIQKLKEQGWEADVQDVQDVLESIPTSISMFLAVVKKKEKPVALAVKDLKGNLLLGAKLTYHPNEDETQPGNWSYEFTTDLEDLEDAMIYLSTDTQYQNVVARVLSDNYNGSIRDGASTVQLFYEIILQSILQWLDVNAKEAEEVTVEHEGFIEASVAVENGEKIIALFPGGNVKTLVKDDAIIEK